MAFRSQRGFFVVFTRGRRCYIPIPLEHALFRERAAGGLFPIVEVLDDQEQVVRTRPVDVFIEEVYVSSVMEEIYSLDWD